MPHYRSGREAKVGDLVVVPAYGGEIALGTVTHVNPGCETCNLYITQLGRAVQVPGSALVFQPSPAAGLGSFTAKDCEFVELPPSA